MKLTKFYQGLLLLVLLTACAGLFPVSTPTPTPVAATDTPTSTIVWFPPTITPTVFPTRTILPTPEQRPGLSDLLFTDTFDQPGLWSTSISSWANAAVISNQLVLTITGQGPASLISLRSQPTLTDFYAEVTVDISLCAGKDQFGMVFRTSPGENNYRFAVTCDGAVRLVRTRSGSVLPLIDWLPTGDAPIGAPAEVKLGVWAVGGEIRIFLNDHYQFTVRDPVLHTGTLGLFVYVNGTAPITASFSELSVYSVSYVSPTPSATPSRTPIPSRTRSP